ncbi:MAG: hypothetical protein ACOYMF_05200 [Bacteroidales bacterium]
MKEKILNWLKLDRKFKTGFSLYNQFGNNLALKTTFNRQGETPFNQQLLMEELRKLAGIDKDDFKNIISTPVNVYLKQDKKVETIPAAPKLTIDPTDIECLKSNLPEPARKFIKLRDEFPFLSTPECPKELKLLVADMLTAYDAYKKAHADCFTAENEEQLLEYAKSTVENYLDNRLIWDELNHYKETGEILGVHPIYEELKSMAEIKILNAKDLAKMKNNIRSSITKMRKSIEKGDKPELNLQRQASLVSKEKLLVEVENELKKR